MKTTKNHGYIARTNTIQYKMTAVTKPDMKVMVPDLYRPRLRRQRRKRPHQVHPEAQEHAYIDILYILMTGRVSWAWLISDIDIGTLTPSPSGGPRQADLA